MKIRPGVFSIAALFALFSCGIAAAQDLQKGVTYVCNGERIFIENCNIRDTSDTSTCMVGHPDTVLSNGLMKYTYETRGALKKLFPTCKQPSADEVARAKAFQKKQNDLYEANVKKANEENDAIEARAQAVITGKKQQTPEEKALNRCVTSGRFPATCMGNTLMKPFGEIVASVLPEVGKELPPGPHFSGNFVGSGEWRIEFDDRFTMTTCGGLDPAQQKYSLVLKNNTAVITIPSNPKEIVLTMRPDGTLVGPGPVTMHGIVTVGHHDEAGVGSSTTRVTEYVERTKACPAPVLSSKGAAPSAVDMGQNVLKGMLSDGETGPPTPPGLRMHGSYGGQGGILVEFFPESVIISCGDAARAYPYAVQVSGALPSIRLEDPAHPIVLAMKPDGELDSGSGPYEVHGRTITGKNDNGDFTFAPLNMTCNLGLLKPGAAPAAPPAATTMTTHGAAGNPGGPVISMPNAPLGNAVLTIVSGFPAQPNVLNPLAGFPYTLLRDSFANALTKAGIQVPPGTSAFKLLGTTCQTRTPECQKMLDVWKSDAISAARGDITGKAILPGVPPGTYYLMFALRYNNQPILWDLKLDLKAGANSVTLDQRNATPVK
jgi:hypothetical protein